jgi:hypothetical protein
VLALISTIDIGGDDLPGVVGRIGVLFLVLALAHAITLGVLSRIRGEQQAEGVMNRGLRRRQEPPGPIVTPVADQESGYPEGSPPLENRSPYTTP